MGQALPSSLFLFLCLFFSFTLVGGGVYILSLCQAEYGEKERWDTSL